VKGKDESTHDRWRGDLVIALRGVTVSGEFTNEGACGMDVIRE
jgi:hypothetical protein